MNARRSPLLVALLTAALGVPPLVPPAWSQTVHAVLFHSPTCPHCRQVITEDLPIFFGVYGGPPTVARGDGPIRLLSNGTLTVLFVDASTPSGDPLFEASYASHPAGGERRGVPRMIVGDSVLVGSVEIPSRLHGIIRSGLATGGIPWPAIPGLDTLVARLEHPGVMARPSAPADSAPPAAVSRPPELSVPARDPATIRPPAPGPSTPAAASRTPTAPVPPPGATVPGTAFDAIGTDAGSTVRQRLRRDPMGNALAIAGLGLMVLTIVAVGAGLPRRVGPRDPGLWIPVIALLGAGVAAYLTFIETSGATAVCGPVGDCNAVQQSPYARLFGILPVGVLGLAGYGVVLVLWVLGQAHRPGAARARQFLVGAVFAGTLFSVYLTALEPFVIGATCLWCLSSAAAMTALLWLAAAWTDPADTAPKIS